MGCIRSINGHTGASIAKNVAWGRGDQIVAGVFLGGDAIPAGTFHGGDAIPAGTFHGVGQMTAGR